MPSKANVQIVGHCGKNMEMAYSASGTAIVSFSVATNKWQPNADPITTWWNVVMFGQRAESLHKNVEIRKGDPVVVFGEPYLDNWTGQDGTERQTLKVVASEVMSMISKADRSDRSDTADQGGQPGHGEPPAMSNDIPFR